MICSVLITKEDNWTVATDISSGVTSQGTSIDDALDNLKEAIELYYEDSAPETRPTSPVFLTTMEVNV